MTDIYTPHDRAFRAALSDSRVAKEFFAQHLPKTIVQAVDLNALQLCPQTYIDQTLKLSQSDILYQTQIGGEMGYLYLVCEQQTTADPLMPFRLLQYNVGIWRDYLKQTQAKTLPLIVNTVFYNGQKPYHYSTDFRDLLKAPSHLIDDVWGKPFTLIDVHHIPDEVVREYRWSGILAFFMKHIFARDFLPYLKQVMGELQALEQAGGTDYVVTLLHYALSAAETADIEQFVETVQHGLSPPIGTKIMTIAEQFMERGKQFGLEQGMQQGRLAGRQEGRQEGLRQGEYAVLLRLLKRKFVEVPTHYLERIEKADENTLLDWAECLMDAKTLQDVFEK